MSSELTEEVKTLVTILRHVRIVQEYLHRIAGVLTDRALTHDVSKLALDEYGGFVEVNRIARDYSYGSQEYKDSLKDNKVIELHFSRNSHHPEHHPNGVNDMNLFDWIEMVCDWRSASKTYNNTDWEEVLKLQFERFKMTPEQVYLVKLIAKVVE